MSGDYDLNLKPVLWIIGAVGLLVGIAVGLLIAAYW